MEAALANEWKVAAGRVPSRPRAARLAVGTLFFLNGTVLATWVSRIPAVELHYRLSHGALGLALLAMALGAVLAMPLAGGLTSRVGSGRICQLAALSYCATLPALILAPNRVLFGLVLFLFGAFHGALDVAMNAQAVAVEKRYHGPIMSSFHALFSAGGLTGAALGGWLARGLAPSVHFALVTILATLAAVVALPHLFDARPQEVSPAASRSQPSPFPWPTRGLLALGAVALCIMMGEGAMADWTAVYLRNNLFTSESLAAVGYAAFSVAMAAGRFFGDRLTARFSPVHLVRLGSVVAATGLVIGLGFATPAGALAGFACVGLGYATLVPLVFSAAGRTTGLSPGVALASVTTMGYLGFLAGPPLIGFIAQLLGLRCALAILVLTSLAPIALASAVRRR